MCVKALDQLAKVSQFCELILYSFNFQKLTLDILNKDSQKNNQNFVRKVQKT